MAWKLDNDGYIGLPTGPGLGVEVDEKRLEEEAKRPQTYRWPGARLRDGSVADY
jgi:galactonate dehydratase